MIGENSKIKWFYEKKWLKILAKMIHLDVKRTQTCDKKTEIAFT